VSDLARTHTRVTVAPHANVGHGPTILRGYREARGEWVLQIDSDGEMRSSSFEKLWQRRGDYDLLLGRRVGRSAPTARRVVTLLARATVRVMYGARVVDVNAPYRLIRRSALQRMVARIPDRVFAPNVIMVGLAARDRLRVLEVPVDCQPRAGGVTSLSPGRALRVAWRCLGEAVAVRAAESRS
jgi:hypothetical protein